MYLFFIHHSILFSTYDSLGWFKFVSNNKTLKKCYFRNGIVLKWFLSLQFPGIAQLQYSDLFPSSSLCRPNMLRKRQNWMYSQETSMWCCNFICIGQYIDAYTMYINCAFYTFGIIILRPFLWEFLQKVI